MAKHHLRKFSFDHHMLLKQNHALLQKVVNVWTAKARVTAWAAEKFLAARDRAAASREGGVETAVKEPVVSSSSLSENEQAGFPSQVFTSNLVPKNKIARQVDADNLSARALELRARGSCAPARESLERESSSPV